MANYLWEIKVKSIVGKRQILKKIIRKQMQNNNFKIAQSYKKVKINIPVKASHHTQQNIKTIRTPAKQILFISIYITKKTKKKRK